MSLREVEDVHNVAQEAVDLEVMSSYMYMEG